MYKFSEAAKGRIRAIKGTIEGIKELLHANSITLPISATASKERTYVVGQSPADWENADSFLAKACESGQGLFQFISTQQQANQTRKSHVLPINQWLLQLDGAAKVKKDNFFICGRFEVLGIAPVMGEVTGLHSAPKLDHLCQQLRFIDHENKEKGTQTVPITQVAMPFENRLLDVKGIQRASVLFKEHCEHIALENRAPDADRMHMFLSTAGFGRNATLMTFHDLEQRIRNNEITNAEQLDTALAAAILTGREQRGYRFVHSDQQVAMLRRALIELLPQPPIQRELAADGTVQPPPTREQEGADLMRALQHAAAKKMVTYAKLPPVTNLSGNDQKVHQQLEFDIGEDLRLQHVLQKFLKDPPPRLTSNKSSVVDALNRHHARQLAAAEARRNDPPAPSAAGDGSGAAGNPVAPNAGKPVAKDIYNSKLFEESNLGLVPNAGADNHIDGDEGNNTLIVSLLQHATGNYDDRCHRDMAKILREGVVARFNAPLNAQNPTALPNVSILHSDTRVRNSLVQMINTLYGCKLKPHWLRLQRVGDALIEEVRPEVEEDKTDEDAERVLIYESPSGYGAVLSKKNVPHLSFLEQAEKRTEEEMVKIESKDGSDNNLPGRLQFQKVQLDGWIGAAKEAYPEEATYPPFEGFANTHYLGRTEFERIANTHVNAKRKNEIDLLKQRFNNQIDTLLLRLDKLISSENPTPIALGDRAKIIDLKYQIQD